MCLASTLTQIFLQSEAYLEGMKTLTITIPEPPSPPSEAYLEGMKTRPVPERGACLAPSEAYLEGMKTKSRASGDISCMSPKPTSKE